MLIVDDVLATGGTAAAATQLVKKCGGGRAARPHVSHRVDVPEREVEARGRERVLRIAVLKGMKPLFKLVALAVPSQRPYVRPGPT